MCWYTVSHCRTLTQRRHRNKTFLLFYFVMETALRVLDLSTAPEPQSVSTSSSSLSGAQKSHLNLHAQGVLISDQFNFGNGQNGRQFLQQTPNHLALSTTPGLQPQRHPQHNFILTQQPFSASYFNNMTYEVRSE
ncbi:hypothetical protein CEUSTIGMA_g11870.t1 [Chlamydomonas eustigma]|uniref:Uncharacterized protein n=1 Tax=Chlamydomonas eustigma TaxID=1157962 RepID=A0A250XNS8_9CHLO|nr:hypothetical protein CEUSTIGMA_g11870.t1 [Chlamydomonas eustigma]|eukprot:GAX84450.1 hypothetical protein CEUSTIGMA_g11870.t1 [Chlamydomonas eustigma]